MKLNNSRLILAALVVFSAFVGLGCIAASDANSNTFGHVANDTGFLTDSGLLTDSGFLAEPLSNSTNNGPVLDGDNNFVMSGRYNGGTGYHWEISPETHGVDLVSQDNVEDHPGACGSSATSYFTFHVNSDDYYVKLILVTPTGDIAGEIDSDMLN